MSHDRTADRSEHRDGRTDAVVFFERAYASFQDACRVTSPREIHLCIADLPVRLRFAGDALIPQLTRALRHHAVPEAEREANGPGLTVCIWDGASTGNNIPTLPFQGDMVTRRGEVKAFESERIELALNRSADTLSLLDRQANLALFCMREARRLPAYESAAPLKTILYWWLRARQMYFVHAGAVGTRDGAVLLAGKGGSGKSTTTLACLAAGMLYLGDDYCLLGGESVPTAFNVYNTAKMTPASAKLVPSLQALAGARGGSADDKTILFLDTEYANQLAPRLPIRAIVLPRVTGRSEPRLVPTTSNAALSALAISTLVQLPNAGNETLRALEEWVNRLPCYLLELGDALETPRVLESLL